MYFKFTLFQSFKTAQGEQCSVTLNELADALIDDVFVNDTGDKTNGPAFSCATFRDDTRGAENVLEASLIALDFDGARHKQLTVDEFESIHSDLSKLGFTHLWYETWSLGLRVVFPLSRPVTADEYARLFDALRPCFRVSPDKTGRTAERLHAAPQVPTAERDATHRAEFVDTNKLLSVDWAPAVAAVVGASSGASSFGGLKLSSVKVGAQARVETFEDLTRLLAASESKQEDLNRYVFALARIAAARGDNAKDFIALAWEAAQEGLRNNARPVEDWQLARRTTERATTAAYKSTIEDNTGVPADTLKRALKFAENGKTAEAGRLVAPYVHEDTTAKINKLFTDAIERSNFITSVPDALTQIAEAAALNEDEWSWQRNLEYDDTTGRPSASDRNVAVLLTQHPKTRDLFKQNVRTSPVDWLTRDAPWGAPAGQTTCDGTSINTLMWLGQKGGGGLKGVRLGQVEAAYKRVVGSAPEFDPARDRLLELKDQWDGVERLSTALSTAVTDEDSEYVRAVSRLIWLTMCVRTVRPGCKQDFCFVLVGGQGYGKSTLTKTLCLDPSYWDEIRTDWASKDNAPKLSRCMVIELTEFNKAAGKKDAEDVKAFITSDKARHRPPYGVSEKEFPRRCVLFATTNNEQFFLDETGARRFLPINVRKDIDLQWLADNRDQLFAEAMTALENGEKHYLTREEQERLTVPLQEPLTRAAVTPEAELILETMEYLPKAARFVRSKSPTVSMFGSLRTGVVGFKTPEHESAQMDGDRMRWITGPQASEILKNAEFKHDGDFALKVLRIAGLKRNKSTERYSVTGKE